MALSITHPTVATGADDPSKEINKGEWNAAHSIAGLGTGVETALGVNVGSAGAFVTFGGALGTPSSGTLTNATGLPVGGISATGTPDSTTFLRGDGTWNAASGGATLDGITAATADQAGISNGDFNVRWNWQKTTNSEVAFTFGESAASTNGTSTNGVPNQVLLRLTTLAASTMSPLSVYSRSAHVFSVSPTAAQVLATTGSVSVPPYSFAAATQHGMLYDATTFGVAFARNGKKVFSLDYDNGSDFWARLWQGSGDTLGARLYGMKSRGSVASPTVITTGDDLLTISGFGYVGATGTYVEAAKITFDSTGTIANNSTGVGGIVRFSTRKVAGSVTERMTVDENETADETSILVSINGGAPVRVSKGAADSGGTGFAVLRIPN